MRAQVRLAALLALTTLGLAGCAGSPWRREKLYASSGVVFFREHKEAEDGKRIPLGFLHPIEIKPEAAQAVLTRLVYSQGRLLKNAVEQPVFTPKEAAVMAEPLCESLKVIGPDDRLRFLVAHSNWTEAFVGTHGCTGAVFRTSDGVLHFAFDRIDERLSVPDDGSPDGIRFSEEPTEVVDESPLVASQGIQLHRDAKTGVTYPRWVEVAVDQVPPLPSPAAPPAQAAAVPAAAAAGAAATQPPPPRTPEDEARYQRVRARLDSLKRLRQDGALTEEEYEAEKKKALAEL